MLTKRELLKSISIGAAAAAAGKPGVGFAQANPPRPGFLKGKDIAEQGYVFGLPIVMAYGAMYEMAIDKTSSQYKAPFNTIYNEARVFTWQDTAVVTPNSDTPYSLLWLDLRAEPMVISVPQVEAGRYFSVQFCDNNTYNYGYIGSRATGNEPGDFLVVGPDWTGPTPAGIKQVFRSTTQFSAAIFRTQLFGADDMDNVKKVQAGYKARPLSAFLNQPAPPPAPTPDFPKFSNELAKTDFFEFLDFQLAYAPARPVEADIRAKLASIGVGPGKSFHFKDLSIEDKLEIGLGLMEGKRKVDEATKGTGKDIDAWRVAAAFGDEHFFNGDWLLRAAAAQLGIYGNNAEEAMYPNTRKDVNGDELDGSKRNYTLTFPAGQFPPVNAFWSVTMYDGKTQFLIKNPIDRYLINSPMLPDLKTNADGSLTLYIQNKSPGADKESNWLPAPDGPIYMVMRLYWPKETPPSILPPGQGTWRPPAVTPAA